MFILGGLSLNALIGSLLFQPIKRHAKAVEEMQEETNEDDGNLAIIFFY